jgi:hypothetical protein
MESQFILPFVLRFLPTILVLGLAFVAASDKKTGRQWANLLYQMGSVRPDQRDDPKIQSSVKWPFIVIAFGLLFLPSHIGPIDYYQWVTRKSEPLIDITRAKSLEDSSATLTKTPEVQPTATPAPQNPLPPGANPASPAPVAPAAPGAPAPSAPQSNKVTPGTIGGLRGN